MTGAYHKFPVTAIAKTMGMGNVIVATIGSEMMKMMRMGSDANLPGMRIPKD